MHELEGVASVVLIRCTPSLELFVWPLDLQLANIINAHFVLKTDLKPSYSTTRATFDWDCSRQTKSSSVYEIHTLRVLVITQPFRKYIIIARLSYHG